MAEDARFELARRSTRLPVFKTGGINRSPNPLNPNPTTDRAIFYANVELRGPRSPPPRPKLRHRLFMGLVKKYLFHIITVGQS